MTSSLVELVVEDAAWASALPDLDDTVEQAARMALDTLPEDHRDAEICVLACNDTRIAALSSEFRGKPAPTNVLSWPAHALSPDAPGGAPDLPPAPESGPIFLGDVAIALQTSAREAKESSRPLKSHVLHLMLHGTLHLLGYDHETPEDAELMEGIERKAMTSAGYPDPYA